MTENSRGGGDPSLGELSREELEERCRELLRFKQEWEKQEEQRLITEEKLEYSWSGNLGRWVWDRETGEVLYNRRKVEVLGYDPDTFGNSLESFLDLIHPEDYSQAMESMRRHLSGKSPVYETEYRMRRIDGEYLWYYDRGSVVDRDLQGKPLRVMGIVFDVTEQKQKEEELARALKAAREANETRDRLYSLVAHDLRSPIHSLKSFLQLMQMDGGADVAKQEELYSEIGKVLDRTETLIENMINWARAQSGRLKPEIRTGDVLEPVRRAVQDTAGPMEGKGISLEEAFGPGSRGIRYDPEMIRAVMRNLLSNAVKYSPRGGRIVLRGTEEEGGYRIAVEDSGAGIPPQRLQELRENVRWVDSQPGTDNERGTGFGISVVRDFLLQHQSRLEIESREGEGSVFSFVLSRESAV